MRTSNKPVYQFLGCLFGIVATISIAGCGKSTVTAKSLLRVHVYDGETADTMSYQAYKQTQAQLIMSPFVLRAALRNPEIAELATIKNKERPIQWLEKNIKAKYPGDSEILVVSLQCNDADEAKQIVDAVVQAYLVEAAQNERNDVAKRLDLMRSGYRQARKDLTELLVQANRLATEIGDPMSSIAKVNQQIALEKIKSIEAQLARLRHESLDAKASQQKTLETAISQCNEDLADERRDLIDMSGFSGELEAKKLEIAILQDRVTTLSQRIHATELQIADRPRVVLVDVASTLDEGAELDVLAGITRDK